MTDLSASPMPPGGAEWLEPDGLGGFASGTVSGRRTRRYHAVLLAATGRGRFVLVNGFDAWVATPAGTFPISTQRYAPGVDHPAGAAHLAAFQAEPWPRWTFRLPGGTVVEQQLLARPGTAATALSWALRGPAPGTAELRVRPFLSGRDYHATHHENGAFRFETERGEGTAAWRPYDGVPGVRARFGGRFEPSPLWYRSFLYEHERARGLDDTEDLASPGEIVFDLRRGEAVLLLEALGGAGEPLPEAPAASILRQWRDQEGARRAAPGDRLGRSAGAYLVRSSGRRTIVAGYPWFTDWGRDTFIALRGLCLATGRLDEAREILVSWAPAVSEGMLPNLFPDSGAAPEYNAVDASLWYVVAAGEYLRAAEAAGDPPTGAERSALHGAMEAILEGYSRGTRYGIRAGDDGLLAAGAAGVQLTWMDARIGDWVVTPRIGKPVEVQALWLNALAEGTALSSKWRAPLALGRASFPERFWNEEGGCLHDVVDDRHVAGRVDPSFRPNQIFAVGGLPMALLEGPRARRLVDNVAARLLTPLGLRSLAPGEPGYAPRYEGGPRERDAVYHQGTVWPWLIGPFVEAWVRVRGGGAVARAEARRLFLEPLLSHLDAAGLGHLPEIADADPPHAPRGCPFQAWSLAEALRLDRIVLRAVDENEARVPARTPRARRGAQAG
ncbi:MAG TPA: amylo-alpha-1,6-glucosidase [Candidatus Polarisedimenticolia bacterium]|nr:amylo-alpha-1,6-glucosidase [Candidatus Polarisedimenticolia bacterium]